MFIQKNRSTVAEPIGETRAELPFTGDQAVCLGHDQAAWSGPASTRGVTQSGNEHETKAEHDDDKHPALLQGAFFG
jgi:hypothetical protein